MLSPPPPPFQTPRWARGGHRQTLISVVWPCGGSYEKGNWTRVRIPLREGGHLAGWAHRGSRSPALLLLHGLGGSSRSKAVRRSAFFAAERGHTVLVLEQRGSGGSDEQTTRPYMTGNGADVGDAVLWLRKFSGGESILATGFSLGGNTLACFLGQQDCPGADVPDRSLAIGSPLNLDRTSKRLLKWPARAYDLAILGSCRRWIPTHRGPGLNPPTFQVPRWSSLREFDERYIVPVWGFTSREEYYATASGANHLENVRAPLAILLAQDDPITLADDAHRMSAYVDLHILPSGGHIGFMGGRGLRMSPWLNHALEHYLDATATGAWRPHPLQSANKTHDHFFPSNPSQNNSCAAP